MEKLHFCGCSEQIVFWNFLRSYVQWWKPQFCRSLRQNINENRLIWETNVIWCRTENFEFLQTYALCIAYYKRSATISSFRLICMCVSKRDCPRFSETLPSSNVTRIVQSYIGWAFKNRNNKILLSRATISSQQLAATKDMPRDRPKVIVGLVRVTGLCRDLKVFIWKADGFGLWF